MNWRRGFFRLWLAIFVVWLGAAVAFNLPDSPERTMYYSPWDDAFHVPPPPVEWNFGCEKMIEAEKATCNAMSKSVDLGSTIKQVTASGLELVFWRVHEEKPEAAIFPMDRTGKKFFFSNLDSPSDAAKQRLASLAALADSSFESEQWRLRRASLRDIALYGLVPPIVLLGVGVVLAWVVAGFGRKT